jgi:hypothetical protein
VEEVVVVIIIIEASLNRFRVVVAGELQSTQN